MTDAPLPARDGPDQGEPHSIDRVGDLGRIGRYRILRKVGEGGMGRVYEAEQDNPRRIVALKVIRAEYAGPELEKRFAHEAQALGRLHHPGIAQIYEAGSAPSTPGIAGASGELGTAGVAGELGTAVSVPFFAMELVRGLPLDDYVARHALSVPARLALFVKICEAVQHAHHNGVIHRDLKPANILVDGEGQPKILDFGLARLTNSDVQVVTMQTDVGQILGTLPYMSPEQVAANPSELDKRSDVYALGVILYQMLSGQLPHDLKKKMLHEAVRVIREDDPRPLSSVDRVFRGDIETIVAKALEKEKERRYPSAADLATDIGRYLRDEPIVARRPSAAYQLRKFAARNRVLVGGIAAVFVVLVIGVVASTLFALRAVEAEKLTQTQLTATKDAKRLADTNAAEARANAAEARTEAAKSAAVSNFLSEMLQAADPGTSRDREVKVRQILDQAAERVDAGSLAGQPEVEISVRRTLGNTYSAIGEFEPAEKHLRAAFASLSSLVPTRVAELADCSYDLALVLEVRGQRDEASPLAEKALEAHKTLSGEVSASVADDLSLLAAIRYNQTRRDEALEFNRRAVEMCKAVYGEKHPKVASALSDLAFHLMETRDLSAARPLLDEAVAILEAAGSKQEVKLARVLKQRGRLRRDDGSYTEAETDLRRALEIYRRIYGNDHYTVADILDALGMQFMMLEDPARAEPLEREALKIRQKTLGDHRDTATSLALVASIVSQRGDIEQALRLSNEALEMRRRLFGEDNAAVADSKWRVGMLLSDKGDLPAAEPLFRQSIDGFNKTIGKDHPDTARPMLSLARLLRQTGGLEEAESLLRQCVEIHKRIGGELSSNSTEARDDLIQVLLERKEWVAAEALLRDILPKYEKQIGSGSPLTALTRIQLGAALAGQKRFEEAEPLMIENVGVILGNKQLWAETKRMSASWVADFYEAAGMPEDAAKWREEAAKWKR